MINNLEILKLLLPLSTGDENKQNSQTTSSDTDYISDYIGKYCIIRTYSMGVYYGKLKKILGQGFQGSVVILENVRIIYSWNGAKTTLDIANNGISGGSLSSVSPEIEVNGVGCIIPCSEAVIKNFNTFSESEYKF